MLSSYSYQPNIIFILVFIVISFCIGYSALTDHSPESFAVDIIRPLTIPVRHTDECSPIHSDGSSTCTHTTFKNACYTPDQHSSNEPSLTVSGSFNVCKDNYCNGKDIGTDAFLTFSDLLANQSGEGVRQMATGTILASTKHSTTKHIKDNMNDLKIKTRTFDSEKKKLLQRMDKVENEIIDESKQMWKTYCENSPFESLTASPTPILITTLVNFGISSLFLYLNLSIIIGWIFL